MAARIRAVPLARESDGDDGKLVRIEGVVEAGSDALATPFFKTGCVGFRVRVAEIGRGSVSLVPGRDGKEVLDTSGAPTEIESVTTNFYVRTETGRVRIVETRRVSFGVLTQSERGSPKGGPNPRTYLDTRNATEFERFELQTQMLLPAQRVECLGFLRRQRATGFAEAYRGGGTEWILVPPEAGELLISVIR